MAEVSDMETELRLAILEKVNKIDNKLHCIAPSSGALFYLIFIVLRKQSISPYDTANLW